MRKYLLDTRTLNKAFETLQWLRSKDVHAITTGMGKSFSIVLVA